MFCYPISDHVIFSREFYFCFVIKYAHKSTWMHMHRTKFERNSSLGVPSSCGLKWENKTSKLKRSIDFQSFSFQYGPLGFLLPLRQYFSCNSPLFSSYTLVRAQGGDRKRDKTCSLFPSP